MPKIISGSKIIFVINPHIMQSMVTCILPTDWKIFSKESPSVMNTAKRKALFA